MIKSTFQTSGVKMDYLIDDAETTGKPFGKNKVVSYLAKKIEYLNINIKP